MTPKTLDQATPVKHKRYHEFRSWLHTQHVSVNYAYKIFVAIAGLTVIAAGLVMVVLPGPGWITVFAGLAILGLEFPFARRITTWVKSKVASMVAWFKNRKKDKTL